MELLTLSYLLKEDSICLALKKRGFGEGNWNGYGGKLEDGEPIEVGAVREIEEESGVKVSADNLQKVAIVDFIYQKRHLEVHTFFVRTWEGEPEETEEMLPGWFLLPEIPYEKMWEDDHHWLPRALQREKLRGKVWFDEDDTHIKKMEWKSVSSF